jgi:hypothetical protein
VCGRGRQGLAAIWPELSNIDFLAAVCCAEARPPTDPHPCACPPPSLSPAQDPELRRPDGGHAGRLCQPHRLHARPGPLGTPLCRRARARAGVLGQGAGGAAATHRTRCARQALVEECIHGSCGCRRAGAHGWDFGQRQLTAPCLLRAVPKWGAGAAMYCTLAPPGRLAGARHPVSALRARQLAAAARRCRWLGGRGGRVWGPEGGGAMQGLCQRWVARLQRPGP